MEQLQELLDILAKTPEMAIWGVGIYLLFLLLKLASWVGALTLVARQFIKRYFDSQEKKTEVLKIKSETEKHVSDNQLTVARLEKDKRFEKAVDNATYADPSQVVALLSAIGNGGSCHSSDITKAIHTIQQSHLIKS